MEFLYIFIKLQPPEIFYQPNYGESVAITGGHDIQIGNTMGSEYAEIEDAIKVENALFEQFENPIISKPNFINNIIFVLS